MRFLATRSNTSSSGFNVPATVLGTTAFNPVFVCVIVLTTLPRVSSLVPSANGATGCGTGMPKAWNPVARVNGVAHGRPSGPIVYVTFNWVYLVIGIEGILSEYRISRSPGRPVCSSPGWICEVGHARASSSADCRLLK